MGPVTRIERLSALIYRTLASADKLPLAPVAGSFCNRHAVVCETVLPLTQICGGLLQTVVSETFQNNRKRCLPTHAWCEAVAAERAGGERRLFFAGQKESRVHPSIKAASEAVAASHAAAAERRPLECKKNNINTCVSHRHRKRGAGKSVPLRQGYGGTGRGVSPRRARSTPWGAGRVLAGISQGVKPRIKTLATTAYTRVPHTKASAGAGASSHR